MTRNDHVDADLGHIALHLAKYAGELAAIAEHAEHPFDDEKARKARDLARDFLCGRLAAIRWCVDAAGPHLRTLAERPIGLEALFG